MTRLVAILAVSGLICLAWFWFHTRGRPIHWFRFQLGWGLGVEELARRLDIDVDRLRSLTPAYREALIPKRSGGHRRLSIPDAATKFVQRRILQRVIRKLRAHPIATAYERGRSIVANAKPHVGRAVVIKLDLVHFFPSCRAETVDRYFRKVGWNREAAALLTRLCCHEGALPQGAPTSPRLSNLILYRFDTALERLVVHRRNGRVTRYADDITISFGKDTPRRIRGVIEFVERLARKHGFEVHTTKKRRILRPHQRQQVTGLVVNAKVQLPRSLRKKLRAVEHHLKTGRPATMTPEQIQGWTAYRKMIEDSA